MARYFVFCVVVGGTALMMYLTKPTEADYLAKLQSRATAIASVNQNAFSQVRGGDPVDEMVIAQTPTHLLEQTHFDDYVLFSVFTTEYERPGYGLRRVRTYGVLSTLTSTKVR